MENRRPTVIAKATRAFLTLSEGKRCYGRMAAYSDVYRDLGALIYKIQRKGIPPGMVWVWNSLNILATRYNRKALQEEGKGKYAMRAFK